MAAVSSQAGGAGGPSEILLKTYSKTIPIPRSTAKDFVNGWNQGLAEIMTEFQDDLRASLATAGLLSSKSGPAIGAARDGLRN